MTTRILTALNCVCTYPKCACPCEPCRYGYHAIYLPGVISCILTALRRT